MKIILSSGIEVLVPKTIQPKVIRLITGEVESVDDTAIRKAGRPLGSKNRVTRHKSGYRARRWSAAEDQELKTRRMQGQTWSKIGQAMNRTTHAVSLHYYNISQIPVTNNNHTRNEVPQTLTQ